MSNEFDVVEVIESLIHIIETSDTSLGYCMCGESMNNHSSEWTCGHVPVDAGEYYAALHVNHAKQFISSLKQSEKEPKSCLPH